MPQVQLLQTDCRPIHFLFSRCDSDVAIYSVQNGVSQPQTATYRPTDSTSMTDHEDSGSPQAAHEAPDSLLTLRLSPAKSWALLTVSVSSSLPCPGTSPVSFPAASRKKKSKKQEQNKKVKGDSNCKTKENTVAQLEEEFYSIETR
ncbi:uncharacterized protein LOC130542137 isoform X3 [Ursus arctos]|uniref:uncharacterized protein LOC130542137 isoform X3 n=1 Tax=Ursus arctos TaxID=9644 RepID=UPI002546B378|nr:uncharacterized protein LOC130542137 isoform X3 [Ursus arctos]